MPDTKYIDKLLESIRAPQFYDFAGHELSNDDERLSGDSWFDRNEGATSPGSRDEWESDAGDAEVYQTVEEDEEVHAVQEQPSNANTSAPEDESPPIPPLAPEKGISGASRDEELERKENVEEAPSHVHGEPYISEHTQATGNEQLVDQPEKKEGIPREGHVDASNVARSESATPASHTSTQATVSSPQQQDEQPAPTQPAAPGALAALSPAASFPLSPALPSAAHLLHAASSTPSLKTPGGYPTTPPRQVVCNNCLFQPSAGAGASTAAKSPPAGAARAAQGSSPRARLASAEGVATPTAAGEPPHCSTSGPLTSNAASPAGCAPPPAGTPEEHKDAPQEPAASSAAAPVGSGTPTSAAGDAASTTPPRGAPRGVGHSVRSVAEGAAAAAPGHSGRAPQWSPYTSDEGEAVSGRSSSSGTVERAPLFAVAGGGAGQRPQHGGQASGEERGAAGGKGSAGRAADTPEKRSDKPPGRVAPHTEQQQQQQQRAVESSGSKEKPVLSTPPKLFARKEALQLLQGSLRSGGTGSGLGSVSGIVAMARRKFAGGAFASPGKGAGPGNTASSSGSGISSASKTPVQQVTGSLGGGCPAPTAHEGTPPPRSPADASAGTKGGTSGRLGRRLGPRVRELMQHYESSPDMRQGQAQSGGKAKPSTPQSAVSKLRSLMPWSMPKGLGHRTEGGSTLQPAQAVKAPEPGEEGERKETAAEVAPKGQESNGLVPGSSAHGDKEATQSPSGGSTTTAVAPALVAAVDAAAARAPGQEEEGPGLSAPPPQEAEAPAGRAAVAPHLPTEEGGDAEGGRPAMAVEGQGAASASAQRQQEEEVACTPHRETIRRSSSDAGTTVTASTSAAQALDGTGTGAMPGSAVAVPRCLSSERKETRGREDDDSLLPKRQRAGPGALPSPGRAAPPSLSFRVGAGGEPAAGARGAQGRPRSSAEGRGRPTAAAARPASAGAPGSRAAARGGAPGHSPLHRRPLRRGAGGQQSPGAAASHLGAGSSKATRAPLAGAGRGAAPAPAGPQAEPVRMRRTGLEVLAGEGRQLWGATRTAAAAHSAGGGRRALAVLGRAVSDTAATKVAMTARAVQRSAKGDKAAGPAGGGAHSRRGETSHEAPVGGPSQLGPGEEAYEGWPAGGLPMAGRSMSAERQQGGGGCKAALGLAGAGSAHGAEAGAAARGTKAWAENAHNMHRGSVKGHGPLSCVSTNHVAGACGPGSESARAGGQQAGRRSSGVRGSSPARRVTPDSENSCSSSSRPASAAAVHAGRSGSSDKEGAGAAALVGGACRQQGQVAHATKDAGSGRGSSRSIIRRSSSQVEGGFAVPPSESKRHSSSSQSSFRSAQSFSVSSVSDRGDGDAMQRSRSSAMNTGQAGHRVSSHLTQATASSSSKVIGSSEQKSQKRHFLKKGAGLVRKQEKIASSNANVQAILFGSSQVAKGESLRCNR